MELWQNQRLVIAGSGRLPIRVEELKFDIFVQHRREFLGAKCRRDQLSVSYVRIAEFGAESGSPILLGWELERKS